MRADLIGEDGVVERIFAGYGVSFRVLARFDGECEACEDMFELVFVVLVLAEFSPSETRDGFELRRAEGVPGVGVGSRDFQIVSKFSVGFLNGEHVGAFLDQLFLHF